MKSQKEIRAILKKAISKEVILKKVVNPFLPTYQVICTNYHIVPGQPVTKNLSKHSFDGIATKEANEFYTKVTTSEFTRLMAPVEIHLKRGFFTLKKTQFGPVEDLKQFKIVNLN